MRGAIVLVTAEVVSQLKWTWFQKRTRPLKDMVTFDEASRGPWGSIKILVQFKGWYG
jgi:hypothetical protein